MTKRESLIEKILNARTEAECESARSAMQDWMQSHPTDFGVLHAAEQLSLISGDYLSSEENLSDAKLSSIDSELTRALTKLSEPAFARVWDNDEDAVYDTL